MAYNDSLRVMPELEAVRRKICRHGEELRTLQSTMEKTFSQSRPQMGESADLLVLEQRYAAALQRLVMLADRCEAFAEAIDRISEVYYRAQTEAQKRAASIPR